MNLTYQLCNLTGYVMFVDEGNIYIYNLLFCISQLY